MGFWGEVTGVGHARRCINHWFGNVADLDDYAKMAFFLTDEGAMSGALEKVSEDIWRAYLKLSGSNRLTRAIQIVGAEYGFRCYLQDQGLPHVVYVDQLTKDKFLANVSSKVLWKDSFGFGHGEFSHSYQWLAAGKHFGWKTKTAQLYAGCVVESVKPLYFLQNGSILKEKVPLWQWLVDATGLRDKQDMPNEWDEDHATYAGHCFSSSFRFANTVHAFLANKPHWFIGHYANRRNKKLDELTQLTQVVLKKELKDDGYSGKQIKEKLSKPGPIQRIGLMDKYENAVVGGVYESSFKLKADKSPDWGKTWSFHGIAGEAP